MSDILATIQQIQELEHVPTDQLTWLIEHSEVVEYAAGDRVFEPDQDSDLMIIILEGKIRVWFDQNGSSREIGRLEKGEVTGLLPYSRLKKARATAVAMEPTKLLTTHRNTFPDMIKTQYQLVEALVHIMANRIRNFTTLQVQNEKLMALGKLSAGLAHELNNPSSAVVRVAKNLKQHLGYQPDGFKKVIAIRMEDDAVDAVNERLFSRIKEGVQSFSMMERSKRENDLEDWLDDNDVTLSPDAIEALIDFAFDEDDMEYVMGFTGAKDLAPVLNWVGNVLTTENLVGEIHDASTRIHDLVTSIKSYSHMDQATDRGQIDIRKGIQSTRRMLAHKFRIGQVDFIEEYADPFPLVYGNPGELNQVWTNIMDNALDAMKGREGSVFTVNALKDGPCLKISLIDNGPGIPADVVSSIFDPFYTTKEMGKGTGLGLDVVRRIVQAHKASIEVRSEPGQTEFVIWFPLD